MHPIRTARLAAGLTQGQLARILNIDRSAITQWESGTTSPRAGRLRDVANALGCTVDDLLPKSDSA